MNEVAGVNITRVEDDRSTNTSRIAESLGINVDRLNEEGSRQLTRIASDRTQVFARANEDNQLMAERLGLDAEKDIGRITEVTHEVTRRMARRAGDVATTGFNVENDFREEVEQEVSAERAFYAAGNIVLSSGTPASMQLDKYTRGEVQAQRIRRDYSLQVRDIKDNASDVMRDALYQVEDIRTETARRITDGNREVGRIVSDAQRSASRSEFDISQTLAFSLSDLHRESGYQVTDINNNADIRIADTSRNLGYDLSDNDFEATKLDQQATLTMLQGDAEFAGLMNQSRAQATAGDDAFTGGLLSAGGTLIGGVANAWYTSQSAANQNNVPIVESVPI